MALGKALRVFHRQFILLFLSLFLVMAGYGIALAVLPFYVERLGIGSTARETVSLHVGLLTAVYPLAQFALAPAWGLWSDRHGRKSVVIAALGGFGVSQVLFGLGTSLPVLYSARVLGGGFSAGLLPAAAAYVAESTSEHERSRGMGWLNASAALGVVAGPALSGLLSDRDWHLQWAFGHWMLDGFSVPFLVVGGLAAALIPLVVGWFPQSLRARTYQAFRWRASWRPLGGRLKTLLVLVVLSQYGMALFMTTFALYASRALEYAPQDIGFAFALCGLITASVQAGAISPLSRLLSAPRQIGIGLAAMAVGLGLLPVMRALPTVLAIIGVLVLGAALISPNLLALISIRTQVSAGLALGLQTTATSLGQIAGPLVGSGLLAWNVALPFQSTAGLLLLASFWMLWRGADRLGKPA